MRAVYLKYLRAKVKNGSAARWACLAAFSGSFVFDSAAVDVPDEPEPQTLTGRWQPRLNLETNGVSPYANLVAESWANVNGGLKTGALGSHFLDFGLEVDTEKIGAWKGGTFHAEGHWVQNWGTGPFTERTGAFNPVSGVAAESHFRAYNLFYRHSLREGRLTIKAGQILADEDFMLSEYSRLFLNSSFGSMPSQVDSPQFPTWPVAAPGIFLRATPLEPLYFQLGLYHGKPGRDVWDNHGFDWASQSRPGVSLFYEAGYKFSPFGKTATVRLGGTFHSGESPDYAAISAGNPNAVDHDITSFYAIQDWTVLENSKGNPRVGLFWRGGIKPEPERRLVAAYTDAGLNWFAPIPGRGQDTVGLAFAWTEFGRDYRRSKNWQVPANEQTVELTYRAQVTRWLSVQGDLQWVINPAGGAGLPKTASVLGVRATASF